MEGREYFHEEQFGYYGLEESQWMLQAVDVTEEPLGEPVRVDLTERVFHHDQDEEGH